MVLNARGAAPDARADLRTVDRESAEEPSPTAGAGGRVQVPVRRSDRYVQRLQASAERVFPLLCPVMEREWIEGWNPTLVLSRSGRAEEDCVFVTLATEAIGPPRPAVWVITEHDPERGRVAFVKTIADFAVTRISIRVKGVDRERCVAEVEYRTTALSPEGARWVEGSTPEDFERFMQRWESRLNHYLVTGRMLRGG